MTTYGFKTGYFAQTSLGLTPKGSPVFVTVKLSDLTDNRIPYHVNDATGLADGPVKGDVDDAVTKKHAQGTDTALGTVSVKNPPVDADKAIYRDSVASDVLVTSTWTQVKAFLKTYFDTLYVIVGGALGTPASGTLTSCTGLPAAGIVPGTAESDFLVATTTPFTWIKKTLVETKALLGLAITAGMTITVTQNTSLDEAVAMSSKLTGSYASAADIITGTEAVKAIAPDQLALSYKTVPTGEVKMWPTETIPAGYFECNGASVSRATYAALFAVISTLYGTADVNNFNLPDLRGRFPRYWDHARALDPDRATRTAPTTAGATITLGDHVGTEQAADTAAHDHTYFRRYGDTGLGVDHLTSGNGTGTYQTVGTSLTGGNETRPVNVYLMPIIKY